VKTNDKVIADDILWR